MEINLAPGKYVVGVSGGVDSVSLLHVLMQQPGLELVVAHFDHGMRDDSAQDAAFVKDLAHTYKLPYIGGEGKLGARASEATARAARYVFLYKTKEAHGARAIITAHHQDDVLETAILNLLRGTGRKGLTSLANTDSLKRPLLHIPKADILDYAGLHHLQWREDSTNTDDRYKRNYVRRHYVAPMSPADRRRWLQLIEQTRNLNQALDAELANLTTNEALDKAWFKRLPPEIAGEVMASWLRRHELAAFDKRTIERLSRGAQVGLTGKRFDVYGGYSLVVTKHKLALVGLER